MEKKTEFQAALKKAGKYLPEEVVKALRLLGFKKNEILNYFASYHLETGFFDQAESFLKDRKRNTFKLKRAELYAIWGYTTRLFYSELNSILRNEGMNLKTIPISRLIISGLKKMNEYEGPAYRVIQLEGAFLDNYLNEHAKGKSTGSSQFISCGSNEKAATRNKTNKNVFEFFSRIKATDISPIADGVLYRKFPPKELLAFPPKRFLIEDVYFDEDEKIQYISLIEMDL